MYCLQKPAMFLANPSSPPTPHPPPHQARLCCLPAAGEGSGEGRHPLFRSTLCAGRPTGALAPARKLPAHWPQSQTGLACCCCCCCWLCQPRLRHVCLALSCSPPSLPLPLPALFRGPPLCGPHWLLRRLSLLPPAPLSGRCGAAGCGQGVLRQELGGGAGGATRGVDGSRLLLQVGGGLARVNGWVGGWMNLVHAVVPVAWGSACVHGAHRCRCLSLPALQGPLHCHAA